MVAGGFSLGAVFRAAKVELQVSSSSFPFAFFSLLSGCFEEAWRLEAMTEPHPLLRGQCSLNPPEKSLETAEGEVRDAELPFRESPCFPCAFSLQQG